MSLFERAKDLGKEIRSTEEFKELEKANLVVKEDELAVKIIEDINEIQQKLSFSERAGVEPDSELLSRFDKLRDRMENNNSIKLLIEAQENFGNVMQQINNAITEGLTGE
jgi:cell fate (sporulation/competence/biofilm development) regulator YlbF (YheA/YmcA/DUF963 family)